MSEPRVNWVRERLLCTLEDAFRSLRAIVEEDIAEMNAWLNTHEKGYRYEISSDEQAKEEFGVHRQLASRENRPEEYDVRVEINREARGIEVRIPAENILLSLSVEWCEQDVACRYFLDNEPVALWEISSKALEPIFFRPRLP